MKQVIGVDPKGDSLKVLLSLGKVLALTFPEGVGLARPPILGNEAFYAVASDEKEVLLVTVWPKLPEGGERLSPERLAHVSTSNLQLFLSTGETVNLGLRIGNPGVEQVVFDRGDEAQSRVDVERLLREQTEKLAATHRVELEAARDEAKDVAMRELALAFITGEPECAGTFDRSMDRFLILTARTICRIGQHVVVAFTIKNRAREDVFRLDRVEVLADDDEDTAPNVESLLVHEGKQEEPFLRFDEELRSAVVFEIKEAWEAARRYQIRVREAGGKKRVVTVDAEF